MRIDQEVTPPLRVGVTDMRASSCGDTVIVGPARRRVDGQIPDAGARNDGDDGTASSPLESSPPRR